MDSLRVVDRGDTVGQPFGKKAKETVNDAGGSPVYTVFELVKHSSLGPVADLALGDAAIREDHALNGLIGPNTNTCQLQNQGAVLVN